MLGVEEVAAGKPVKLDLVVAREVGPLGVAELEGDLRRSRQAPMLKLDLQEDRLSGAALFRYNSRTVPVVPVPERSIRGQDSEVDSAGGDASLGWLARRGHLFVGVPMVKDATPNLASDLRGIDVVHSVARREVLDPLLRDLLLDHLLFVREVGLFLQGFDGRGWIWETGCSQLLRSAFRRTIPQFVRW